MKTCPACDRTFDDTMTFCLDDGSLLSAPHKAGVDAPTVVLPVGADHVEQETVVRTVPETVVARAESRTASPTGSKALVYVLASLLGLVLIFVAVRESGLASWVLGGGGAATPMAAANAFNAACRDKNIGGLKTLMSKQTIGGITQSAKESNKSLDGFLVELADIKACQLTEPRNEVINGDMATVEIRSGNDWAPVRFIKEDGGWKIAF